MPRSAAAEINSFSASPSGISRPWKKYSWLPCLPPMTRSFTIGSLIAMGATTPRVDDGKPPHSAIEYLVECIVPIHEQMLNLALFPMDRGPFLAFGGRLIRDYRFMKRILLFLIITILLLPSCSNRAGGRTTMVVKPKYHHWWFDKKKDKGKKRTKLVKMRN